MRNQHVLLSAAISVVREVLKQAEENGIVEWRELCPVLADLHYLWVQVARSEGIDVNRIETEALRATVKADG